MGLKNIKHEKFALEYVKSGNALQSAINAGYSPKWSKGNSYTLVENSGIKKRIEELQNDLKEVYREDISKVINKLKDIALNDTRMVKDMVVIDGVITEYEIEKSVSQKDQISASKEFLTICGIYNKQDDKTEEITEFEIVKDLYESD